MRAYLICPDPRFLLAIILQKIKGEGDPKLLSLPILMITAQKTYQTLLQEGSTYNAPQTHESPLVALAAKYGLNNNSNNKAGNSKSKKQERNKKPEWMSVGVPTDGTLTKAVDG